jgi:MoxR-like ATPase
MADSRLRIIDGIKKANKRADAKAGGEHGVAEEYNDHYGHVDLSLAVLKSSGNLALVGPTGTGKTHLVKELQRVLSEELGTKVGLYMTRGTSDLMSHNLWTDIRLVPNPSGQGTVTEVVAGVATQWLMHDGPAIFFFDEATFTMMSILSGFMGVADHTRTKVLHDLKDEDGNPMVLKRADDKYFVIAYNPSEKSEYAGTFQMNIAFLRRFEGMWIDYLPEDVERDMLDEMGLNFSDASRLTQFAAFTRQAYQDGDLVAPITLGNLKEYAKMIQHHGVDLDDILTLIKGKYPEAQHEIINALWGQSS